MEKRSLWVIFFEESFYRCLKLVDASIEEHTLIMFSDASESAYGACGYAHLQLADGNYSGRLITAKNRVTPAKEMSVVQKELEAAVLAKRLQNFILKEIQVQKCIIYPNRFGDSTCDDK